MKLMNRPKVVGQVLSLPLDRILPSPHQPRRDFDLGELDSLAKSIAENGLLSPVTVRRAPGEGEKYFLVAGERRLLACRRLGYREIPAILWEGEESDAAVLTLIENLHRQDLNCFEEAEGIYALMKESGLSQQKICAMLATPEPTVANNLRLLKLDPEVRQYLLDQGLGERTARTLLALSGAERQMRAARHIAEHRLTARQAEAYVASLAAPRRPGRRAMGRLRDLRLLFSPVDKAVEEIRRCGVAVQAQTVEEGDYVCYTIRVPKGARPPSPAPSRETATA